MASNYVDEESDIEYGNLKFHEKLGEGGSATVKRVTFKQPYKGYREAAAKITRDLGKEEVDILRKVEHPNIVPLLGFYQDDMFNLIILQYAPLGSLYEYLKTSQVPVPDMLFRKWAREALLALNYLHSKRILHRDIKPQNSLLFEDDTLKLCDFGLAREINHSQSTSSQKGTDGFMAPELIKTNDRNHSTYSIYSDVYAYGMLILTIYTRKPPFDGEEWAYVMFHVGKGELKPQIPDGCPDYLSELMQRCWNVNPKERPNTEIILDEYFPGATASTETDRFPKATASTEADRFPEATASTEADRFPKATASTEADRFPKATASTEADRFSKATASSEADRFPKATASTEADRSPEATASTEADRQFVLICSNYHNITEYFPEATASTEADRFPEATASTEADRSPEAIASTEADRQEVLEKSSSLQDASQMPDYTLRPGGREMTDGVISMLPIGPTVNLDDLDTSEVPEFDVESYDPSDYNDDYFSGPEDGLYGYYDSYDD